MKKNVILVLNAIALVSSVAMFFAGFAIMDVFPVILSIPCIINNILFIKNTIQC